MKKCHLCKKSFTAKYPSFLKKRRFCSAACRIEYCRLFALFSLKGEANPSWKGGEILRNGYIKIKKLSHPNRDCRGYVFLHRIIMENKLGRYLKKYEFVHHINGNRLDNNLNNLELISHSNHARKHRLEDIKNGIKLFVKKPSVEMAQISN